MLFAVLSLQSTLSFNAAAQDVSTIITNQPVSGLTVDNGQTVYFSRHSENAHYKIAPGGTPVVLSTDFKGPTDLVFDPAGDVIVSDKIHIDRVATGTASPQIIAGAPHAQGYNNGPAATARFRQLACIARDPANGGLYACQSNSTFNIRKIDSSGMVSTFLATSGNTYVIVRGMAVDGSGNLYFSESTHHTIQKMSPAGVKTLFAGSGSAGYADGTGAAASFNVPRGIAFDAQGNLYVADSGNNRIRKITPAGVVSTYAGSGAAARTDGLGTGAAFHSPKLLAMDASDTLYVAEEGAGSIRKIAPPRVARPHTGSVAASTTATLGSATIGSPRPGSPGPPGPVLRPSTAIVSLPATGRPSLVTCGQWGLTRLQYLDDVREMGCGGSYTVKRGNSLTFDINYNCVTNGAACVTTYSATLTQPNGASSVVPIPNNTQWTPAFTQPGTYVLRFGASCNALSCQNACTYSIVVQ